jgi:hypothetical protein
MSVWQRQEIQEVLRRMNRLGLCPAPFAVMAVTEAICERKLKHTLPIIGSLG